MSTARSTGTKSIDRTWKSAVLAADPDYEAEKRKDTEYRFSNGREFKANVAKRGAYAED